jgi:hypothetical protein
MPSLFKSLRDFSIGADWRDFEGSPIHSLGSGVCFTRSLFYLLPCHIVVLCMRTIAAAFDVLAMLKVSLFTDRFITVSVIGKLAGY